MLAEALEWLLTPAPRAARRMGHLAESIAIRARYRRCREVWAPHRAQTRAALLDSVARDTLPARRRIALVLGSGPLIDIPLAELSAHFEAVWLADLVHPWPSRWQARRFANVRLITHDVSECLDALCAPSLADPMLLAARTPRCFLDEAAIDWVASVNLVSQLPRLPAAWLLRRGRVHEAGIDAFAAAMMRAHLAWLAAFKAPVCLIADQTQTEVNAQSEVVAHADYRPLFQGWEKTGEWRWEVAPPGELSGGGKAWHSVAAWRKPGQPGVLHSTSPV